jgi:CBS domain containing-hemolysin-like protein
MTNDEVKAVLEKQLQLLSEHSENHLDSDDEALNNDTASMIVIINELQSIEAMEIMSERDKIDAKLHNASLLVSVLAIVIAAFSIVIATL